MCVLHRYYNIGQVVPGVWWVAFPSPNWRHSDRGSSSGHHNSAYNAIYIYWVTQFLVFFFLFK